MNKKSIVVLIDPRGAHHSVENIQEFVRDHYELFDSDEDVVERQCPEHVDGRKPGFYTRADRGLRALADGIHKSWKGWTLKQ